MTIDRGVPTEYLVGHIEDALARDPRVSENDLHVRISAGRVLVHGTVSTDERRRAIPDVVHGLLPECEVVNEATVTDYPEVEDVEQLS